MTPGDPAPQSDLSAPASACPDDGRSAEARIGRGLVALEQLAARPLAEHAPLYEALHDDLQAVLGQIDGA